MVLYGVFGYYLRDTNPLATGLAQLLLHQEAKAFGFRLLGNSLSPAVRELLFQSIVLYTNLLKLVVRSFFK